MNLNNRKIQFGIIAIIAILIFIIWILFIQNNNKNIALSKTKIELEQVQAPKNKLLSYGEERTKLKNHEEYLKNELITIQEWIKFVQENVKKIEAKIRCQRAVVVWAEKGECEEEKTYKQYLLK